RVPSEILSYQQSLGGHNAPRSRPRRYTRTCGASARLQRQSARRSLLPNTRCDMARVPVVESPCPIAGKQLPAGASEHCTLCDRSVHNLDRMSERERRVFMGTCSGKVCVAYTVKIPIRHRGGLAAATLAAAALVSLPAAADTPESPGAEPPAGAMSPLPGAAPRLPN